jgi:hypothetical protein
VNESAVTVSELDPSHSKPMSELDLPQWSVVSFAQVEASNLTYTEATSLLAELESKKVAGLCIVTDEAASRVSN